MRFKGYSYTPSLKDGGKEASRNMSKSYAWRLTSQWLALMETYAVEGPEQMAFQLSRRAGSGEEGMP